MEGTWFYPDRGESDKDGLGRVGSNDRRGCARNDTDGAGLRLGAICVVVRHHSQCGPYCQQQAQQCREFG